MKTIFKILLVIGCLTFFAQNAKAEDTLNPCWDMYYQHIPEHGYFNPDSVLYDTCKCPGMKKFDCTYIYARQWYDIIFFNKDPYNLPEFPYDTIIERTWQELDSSFVVLRNMFQNVGTMFGQLILRKKYPEETDSTSLASRAYLIKFQNYCKIDSLVNLIDTSGFVYDFYYRNALFHDDTYYIDEFNKYDFEVKLFPNPCSDFIEIKIKNNYINSLMYSIIDIYGKKINFQNLIIQNPDEFTFKINTSNLPIGIYYIKFNNGRQIFYEKFIVLR